MPEAFPSERAAKAVLAADYGIDLEASLRAFLGRLTGRDPLAVERMIAAGLERPLSRRRNERRAA